MNINYNNITQSITLHWGKCSKYKNDINKEKKVMAIGSSYIYFMRPFAGNNNRSNKPSLN